jgi:dTDP-4-amino-4,6-dideoxygalactose transaminase
MRIRLSQPVTVGRELDYLRQALAQGRLSGDGPFARRCEEWLCARLRGAHVRLTHSGTAALELAALLAEIGAGDEVIMPAFTFVTCANAVALRGATPVLIDIRADTLNLDPDQAAQAITARTRAIVAVHYAGVPCDMDAIAELARRHDLLVIEDAAQAIMSSYRERPAGTLGHLGAFSFHDTKNVTCGEGGALVVNDGRLAARAEIAYQKGTDRTAFDRGEQPRYQWIGLGSSFASNELCAAVLLAQLEHAEETTRRRRAMWERYHACLADLETAGLVRRPVVPADVEHNGHIYYLLLPDQATRDRFMAQMGAAGVATPFHFVPLDDTPGGRRHASSPGELPVTHSIARRLVRLPLWLGMEPVQDEVIELVRSALAPAPAHRAGAAARQTAHD